jgi:3-phosphoshikimate 1-carboxyvinyltransferase
LKDDLVQSDGQILKLLRKMGVRFTKTDSAIKMTGPFELKGGEFSLKNCPDLLPVMAVLALFARGRSRFYDIGHTRVKESDRISDLRRELLKIGARISEKDNEMCVYPQDRYREGGLLDPHRDHRLAMAFAVLGLKVGARVKDIECVSKSYPAFVKDLKKLSVRAVLS